MNDQEEKLHYRRALAMVEVFFEVSGHGSASTAAVAQSLTASRWSVSIRSVADCAGRVVGVQALVKRFGELLVDTCTSLSVVNRSRYDACSLVRRCCNGSIDQSLAVVR